MLAVVFWTVSAWLSTSATFGGVPVWYVLRRDARHAEAAGVPNARAVMTRRFFIPRPFQGPLSESLAGRLVWVDYATSVPQRQKRAVRIVSVTARTLVLEDGITFEPRWTSRSFANGAGAATGAFTKDQGRKAGSGLLVLT